VIAARAATGSPPLAAPHSRKHHTIAERREPIERLLLKGRHGIPGYSFGTKERNPAAYFLLDAVDGSDWNHSKSA